MMELNSKTILPTSSLPVQIHEEWLRYALEMLINNSVRAVQRDGSGVISISLSQKDHQYAVIRVQDTGSGIPEKIRDKLFLNWIQEKETDGLGIGLMIVHAIAQAYQGKVFCSDPGPGTTTMELWLPLSFVNVEPEH